MRILFEKMCSEAIAPTHNHSGDAGLDFYSVEDIIIPPQQFRVVGTGIRVEIPEGYVGLLFPKGKNDHLLGAGVIDTYYEGEVLFKVVNTLGYHMAISFGDSLGQMIFVPFVEPDPKEVLVLESRDSGRGASGGIKEMVHDVLAYGIVTP